jgi:hypothetical protein
MYAPLSIVVLLLGGCTIGSRQIPGVLMPPPADLQLNKQVSDWDVLYYSHAIKMVFQGRAFNAEHGDLYAAFATGGLAGASSIAAAGQASGPVIATIVSVGALISNAASILNPAFRASVLTEGVGLVLTAEGNYFISLTDAGIKRISQKQLTPHGARFLADVNAAVAITGKLLTGSLPSVEDIKRLQPSTPKPATANPTIAAEVNKELP